LAVANTTLLKVLRGGMQYVQTIAAVFVVLSGLYLVYYFWVVDVNESIDPITSRVERFQLWVLSQLSDNWEAAAVVMAGVVVAAVVFVMWRRSEPPAPADEPAFDAVTDTTSEQLQP
jgi:cytochrome c-type biogenesis protein